MNIRVFADQDPDVTGVFYKAFGQAISREIQERRGCARPGVRYTELQLGKIENHPTRAANRIAAQLRADEVAVIVWDAEDRDEGDTAAHLRELSAALLSLGLDESRARLVVVKPVTEALYLIDTSMEEVFHEWDRGRGLPHGDDRRRRRAKDTSTPRTSRIQALARQRRAYGRRPIGDNASLLAKERVQEILRIRDADKRPLAALMKHCIEAADYQLPRRGANVVLDGLRDWLEESITGVTRRSACTEDADSILGLWEELAERGDVASASSCDLAGPALARALADGTHFAFVAVADRLVGFALAEWSMTTVRVVAAAPSRDDETRHGLHTILVEGVIEHFERYGYYEPRAHGGLRGAADPFPRLPGWLPAEDHTVEAPRYHRHRGA